MSSKGRVKQVAKTAAIQAARSVSVEVWLWTLLAISVLFVIVFGSFMALANAKNTDVLNGVGGDVPSAYAKEIIPADMLELYQSEAVRKECPTLSWTVVAAIIHLESNDNRNPGLSSAGARGASQFMPDTWNNQGNLTPRVGPYGKLPQGQGYAMDGDGDGIADIMNPRDSVPATARMICANGGGKAATLPNAIYAYNHAWWYVDGGEADNGSYFVGVLPLSKKLGQPAPVGGGIGPWVLPIQKGYYSLTARFGETGPNWSDKHTGLDFAAPTGTRVVSVSNGEVIHVGYDNKNNPWAGNHVIVKMSDGTEVWYCHLNRAVVTNGQLLTAGSPLGNVGATGNVTGSHLHLEVRPPNGVAIDPDKVLRSKGVIS